MTTPDCVVAILDVGHGNSTVVKDNRGVVVIDAGPKSGLLEFLTEQNINRIDTLLISHADQDHIGGIIALLASRQFTLGTVRLNTDSLKGSDAWDDLLYELDQLGYQNIIDFRPSLTVNDSGDYDLDSFKIQILGPSNYLASKGPGSRDRQERKISTNSISAVIKILDPNLKPIVVLPGDVDEIGLDDLIDHQIDASAPILVYPHHGGFTGSPEMIEEFTYRLCRLVSPTTVIFSIERKRYNNPRPEIIATLLANLKQVRIMCTQLSEHCAENLPKTIPTHLADAYARGRESNQCCAGSVIIDLSLTEPVIPLLSLHQQFVDVVAPTALCRHRK
jgi:competence protein ComEC